MQKLLTRDQFRTQCLERDRNLCVVCGSNDGIHVHHIIERRLWPSDSLGNFLDNGASVCEPCHLLCEQTVVSCDDLREKCGIKTIHVPDHMYADADSPYDKWGNPILPNGQRMMGELFNDESVQKALLPVIHLFTNRVKYPRTYHLPFSNATKDDRSITEANVKQNFVGKEVVITVKQDGENTTFYRDGLHARSLTYDPHASRDLVRALHAKVSYEIPPTWRICGENLYARHSIHYQNLKSYFQVFSIWDGLRCLPWDETVEWCNILGLTVVPVLYRGVFKDFSVVPKEMRYDGDDMEGYVIRLADEFHYAAFRNSVAKYVRPNHVTSDSHWKFKQVVPNTLKP